MLESKDVHNIRNAKKSIEKELSLIDTADKNIERRKPTERNQDITFSTVTAGDLTCVLERKLYKPYDIKAIPSRVVNEEDYVDIIETIIQRDFFPDLHKLRLEKTLVDIYSGKETASSVLQIKKQIDNLKDCHHLLFPTKRIKLLDGREMNLDLSKISLQEFQSLFTSEDNASFEKLITFEKQKLAFEQSWIELAALNYNDYNNKLKQALQKNERPAALIGSNVDGRNALMFPISEKSAKRVYIERGESDKIYALTYKKSNDNLISNHSNLIVENTRLPDFIEMNRNIHRAAVVTKQKIEEEKEKTAIFDAMMEKGIDHALELIQKMKEKKKFAQTADVKNELSLERNFEQNAFSEDLVPTWDNNLSLLQTPVIIPGENAVPIMTWGKVNSTPVPHVNETEARFSIPEPSHKDLVSMKLINSASKNILSRKQKHNSYLRTLLTPLLSSSANNSVFGTTPTPHIRLQTKLLQKNFTGTPFSVCSTLSHHNKKSSIVLKRSEKLSGSPSIHEQRSKRPKFCGKNSLEIT